MKFLDPDTESAVRDFLARIPADIRLEQAILFGSRARGEHRPDSDADVALILHERGDDGMTLMILVELVYYAYLDRADSSAGNNYDRDLAKPSGISASQVSRERRAKVLFFDEGATRTCLGAKGPKERRYAAANA